MIFKILFLLVCWVNHPPACVSQAIKAGRQSRCQPLSLVFATNNLRVSCPWSRLPCEKSDKRYEASIIDTLEARRKAFGIQIPISERLCGTSAWRIYVVTLLLPHRDLASAINDVNCAIPSSRFVIFHLEKSVSPRRTTYCSPNQHRHDRSRSLVGLKASGLALALAFRATGPGLHRRERMPLQFIDARLYAGLTFVYPRN